MTVQAVGNWEDESAVLGTNVGLILLRGRKATNLFPGNIYGITFWGGRIYFVSRIGGFSASRYAVVLSGILHNRRVLDLRVEIANVDFDSHQLDFIEGRLFITETSLNLLSEYIPTKGKLLLIARHYPRGKSTGTDHVNYVHINSLFSNGNNIFLVYHNLSERSGKPSEIARVDKDTLREIGTEECDGLCAHNFIAYKHLRIYCDSLRGRLMNGKNVIFSEESYLRGLALTANSMFVGGSAFGPRKLRHSTDLAGMVFKLDNQRYTRQASIKLLGVPAIREVRIVSERDFSLSGNCFTE